MIFASKSNANATMKTPLLGGAKPTREAGQSAMDECKIDVAEESAYFPANTSKAEIPTQNSSKLFSKVFHSVDGVKRFDLEKKILEFLDSSDVSNLHLLNKNTWKNVFENKDLLKEYTTHILDYFQVEEYEGNMNTFFSYITNLPVENVLRQEVLAKKDILNPDLTEQDYFNFSFDMDKILNLETSKLRKKEVKKLILELNLIRYEIFQVDFYKNNSHVSFASGKIALQRSNFKFNFFKAYLISGVSVLLLGLIIPSDRAYSIIMTFFISVYLILPLVLLITPRSAYLFNKIIGKLFKDKENNGTTSLLFSDLTHTARDFLQNIYADRNNYDFQDYRKFDRALKILFTTDYFQLSKHIPRPLA